MRAVAKPRDTLVAVPVHENAAMGVADQSEHASFDLVQTVGITALKPPSQSLIPAD